MNVMPPQIQSSKIITQGQFIQLHSFNKIKTDE